MVLFPLSPLCTDTGFCTNGYIINKASVSQLQTLKHALLATLENFPILQPLFLLKLLITNSQLEFTQIMKVIIIIRKVRTVATLLLSQTKSSAEKNCCVGLFALMFSKYNSTAVWFLKPSALIHLEKIKYHISHLFFKWAKLGKIENNFIRKYPFKQRQDYQWATAKRFCNTGDCASLLFIAPNRGSAFKIFFKT